MTTMTVRSHVGPDGALRLEVPIGLPPGPVEVVVVVQPASPSEVETTQDRTATGNEHRPHRARSGMFLNRGLSGINVDATTREMEAAWKAKITSLEP